MADIRFATLEELAALRISECLGLVELSRRLDERTSRLAIAMEALEDIAEHGEGQGGSGCAARATLALRNINA